jgi:hypothetical protein
VFCLCEVFSFLCAVIFVLIFICFLLYSFFHLDFLAGVAICFFSKLCAKILMYLEILNTERGQNVSNFYH